MSKLLNEVVKSPDSRDPAVESGPFHRTQHCTSATKSDDNFSFSRVLISGAGFLADAYDLFVINVAVDLMDRAGYHQALTDETKSTIKSMALAGAVIGQLGFGSIADLIGRRKVFIMTCSLVIVGAVLSAAAQDSPGSFGIYSQISLWRFILGVGVGGEYPLSAAVTSESSAQSEETRNLALVFSMQGVGTLLCSLILVTVTNTMGDDYGLQWRVALALGALPMVTAFYFRWKMHETSWKTEANPPELQDDTSDAAHGANGDRAGTVRLQTVPLKQQRQHVTTYCRNGLIYVWHTVKEHRWALLGTAGAWFILDVVFYANGLFSGQVTTAMGFGSTPRSEAAAALVLQVLALPGYLCTVRWVDRIGLKRLQMGGFLATTVFFFMLAVLQPYLLKIPALYVIMYGCTFFFQNFGANPTTYIIPSVVFPTAHRATCHGISSAAGKLGALLGAQVFLYLTGSFCRGDSCTSSSPPGQVNAGLQITFFVCGALAIVGFVWTYYLIDYIPPSGQGIPGPGKSNSNSNGCSIGDDSDGNEEEVRNALHGAAGLEMKSILLSDDLSNAAASAIITITTVTSRSPNDKDSVTAEAAAATAGTKRISLSQEHQGGALNPSKQPLATKQAIYIGLNSRSSLLSSNGRGGSGSGGSGSGGGESIPSLRGRQKRSNVASLLAATRGLRDQRNSHHRARNSSEKSKSDRYSALPVSDKLVLVGAMESDSSGSSSSGGWSGSSSGSDSGREGDICPDSSPDIRNYSPSSGSSRRATHSDNNILQKPPVDR